MVLYCTIFGKHIGLRFCSVMVCDYSTINWIQHVQIHRNVGTVPVDLKTLLVCIMCMLCYAHRLC